MATWLGCAVLGLSLGGCSIEGTRQRGDQCLQDRECVSPLRCEVTPDGRSLCVTPTRLDAGAPVDGGTPDSGAAPADIPDVPAVSAPPDVPGAVDVRPPADVPSAVDVPLPIDVGTDVGTDVGAVVTDGGAADARADASADDGSG